LQNEIQAVVAKGISAPERVVTTGFVRLKDGSRVTVGEPEAQPDGGNSAPATISTAISPPSDAAGEPREHGKGRRKRENAAEAGNGKSREADTRKPEGNAMQ
jgi:membrane fusion protein, multidrug efflux system